VRVFAVGKGSEYFKDATVDNTDIAKFIIKAIDGE
jgi:alkaline phosphatase